LGNRTTTPAFGVGGGTGNLVRRPDFDDLGGYATLHNAVVDDLGMAIRLRALGKRTHALRADNFISIRMYRGAREVIDGFTKNVFAAFGGFPAFFVLLPMLVLFHFVPYLLLFRGDVLAFVVVGLISLCRLIVDRRRPWAIVTHPLMLAVWSWIFIRSAWMTGVRRRVEWRGRTYDKGWSRFGARR
jgi:chlorobactene glucosyltransferase